MWMTPLKALQSALSGLVHTRATLSVGRFLAGLYRPMTFSNDVRDDWHKHGPLKLYRCEEVAYLER
jgi:hypothetical protein